MHGWMHITTRLADNDFPGIQYVVATADSVLFQCSAGLADIGNRVTMQDSTMMMAYSMTKTIAALVVLQLVQEGRMELDAPIERYVPFSPYGPSVTVRHLLSQTSGIPNPIPLKWVHLAEDHETFDERTALRQVLADNDELDDDPGDGYAYSNISYWLLGVAVEEVTGQPFAAVVSDNVLKPLQISEAEAGFIIDDSTRLATGYLKEWSMMDLVKGWVMDDQFFGPYEDGWMRFNRHYLNGPAVGGLICSSSALVRILQDLLQPSSILLRDSTRALFLEIQRDSDGDPVPMTLGWHVDLDRPGMFYKEGGGGGFHGMMRIYPDQRVVSVVNTNATSFDAADFLDRCDPLIAAP